MSKTAGAFRIVPRPVDISSTYLLLVVDHEGLPHLPLTAYYKQLEQDLTPGAARTYLNTLLPYFSWLATDPLCQQRGDHWEGTQERVQFSVRDYLRLRLGCQVRPRETYEVVMLTAQSTQTVRVFLAALKRFYSFVIQAGWYQAPHPLKERAIDLLQEIQGSPSSALPRKMPSTSGIEAPPRRYSSENYFRLVYEEWIPTSIDDPELHRKLLASAKLANLSLRDLLIVRIAYESGARISEILGLTIGDWQARGSRQEALTFSKGSNGRRVKFLRFSPETAKLLHLYVEGERKAYDPQERGLLELAETDPLFLSRRHQAYRYQGFVPHWKALCQAAGIALRIHGLRHWHTTQAMRWIYETTTNPVELDQRKQELKRYMAWRSPETVTAYDHYFQTWHYVAILDQLHLQFMRTEQERPWPQGIQPAMEPRRQILPLANTPLDQGAETVGTWDRLLALGGVQEKRDAASIPTRS